MKADLKHIGWCVLFALFFFLEQWHGYFFCPWQMHVTDKQSHQIMLSLALNVKQGSCKSSLWLCTATNEMLSELISVPFTASLTKCGKSYIWADPLLLYPSITPGAGMVFALLVLAGNNGHMMGWRWTYLFIWYFSTASFRIWNCKSLSFYSQKGFKFELYFCFIFVGLWDNRPQEHFVPWDLVISSLCIPALFPVHCIPCLHRLQVFQTFSCLLIKSS